MTTQFDFGFVPKLTLGQRLRIARETTGLEQREFAEELGTSRQTIGAAENGRAKPRELLLRAWALRTGVSLEWLKTGQVKSPSPDGEGLEARHEGFEPPTFCLGVVAGQRAA